MGRERIKDLIRIMTEQGYHRQTPDKYSLIRLTAQSEQLLDPDREEPFLMFCKKDEEKESISGGSGSHAGKGSGRKGSKSISGSAGIRELTEKEQVMFEELRKLRTELAKERSVPPYIVASDKTLKDMCVRMPQTDEEMLEANGMGAKKLAQYGGRFLERIREFTYEKQI